MEGFVVGAEDEEEEEQEGQEEGGSAGTLMVQTGYRVLQAFPGEILACFTLPDQKQRKSRENGTRYMYTHTMSMFIFYLSADVFISLLLPSVLC